MASSRRSKCTQGSIFDALHGGLDTIAPMAEMDLTFSAADMDEWFENALVVSDHSTTYLSDPVVGDGAFKPQVDPTAPESGTLTLEAGASPTASSPAAAKPADAAVSTVMPDLVSRTPVFMRAYLSAAVHAGPPRVDPSYVREIAEFSASNDPAWAFSVQQLSMQCYTGMLDPATMPSSGPSRQLATTINAHPAACELRKTWSEFCRQRGLTPQDVTTQCPHITMSTSHFVFRVEPQAADDDADSVADSFFTAQVQITNHGKNTCRVMIGDQLCGEDSDLRPVLAVVNDPSVDYHLATDRDELKRGETSNVLASIIVRSHADFGIAHFVACMAIGTPDVNVKAFFTVSLINPHGAVFAVPLPLSCTSLVQNPLGVYRVPAVFATLLAVFFVRNGPAAACRGSITADTSDDVAAVHAARASLDDQGHVPFLAAIRTDGLPPSIALLGPNQLFSAALLWLCEYPQLILPADITTSDDPMRFLAESVPSECHGIVLSVIDACCKIAISKDHPCLNLVVLMLSHAMATATINVLMGQRGSNDQMVQAAECARCATEHLVAWVNAFLPRYVKPAHGKHHHHR